MNATTRLLSEIGARISGGENKKSFNLLYKGIHNVDVEEFHVQCNAKGPTVTVLYGKYNTLFGGYTSKDWSSNQKRPIKDNDAFLFFKNESVGAECIFLPIIKERAERAIICDENFGPTFGGSGMFEDYDLQTFKKDKKPESEIKNGYLQLNGKLNVPCAYDVERRYRSRLSFLRPETTSSKQDQDADKDEGTVKVKIKSKDINSGTMHVKRIEVYQVVDDELPEPWRRKPEDDECLRMRQKQEKMEPLPGLNIKQYNILLVGIIGSGKSSFYNTLATVFSRKVIPHAPAGDSSTSITNEVKAYSLVSERDTLKVRIYDIRGFEDERGYDHELELLLDGKLRIGYQMIHIGEARRLEIEWTRRQRQEKYTTIYERCSKSLRFPDTSLHVEEKYLQTASLNDEMHLVCFVTGISNYETLTSNLRSRIDTIKSTVRKKGLPIVVVATKFDQVCPKISENADHLYKSPKAECAARAIASFFGVSLKHVFPVVNYVSECDTCIGKDRLALQAFHEMIDLTEAHFQKHKDMTGQVDKWAEREKALPSLRNANEKDVALKELHNEMSEIEGKKLRVLVIGATSSGKSSFIDSISSALRGDIVNRAAGGLLASGVPEGDSSTERFQIHPMKCKHESGRLKNSNVYFGDIPGFQEVGGITVEHVKYILKGHVPNKFRIINGIEKDSKGFIPHPRRPDKIHCVCFVFDCKAMVDGISDTLKTKLKNAIHVVSEKEIPYIAILTKCDENNEAVMEDKRRVFTSKIVTECKDKVMDIFKFKQNLIFPVVNYVNESTVDLQIDVLLIVAFSEILKKGKEYLEDSDDEEDDEDFEA